MSMCYVGLDSMGDFKSFKIIQNDTETAERPMRWAYYIYW